MNDLDTRRNVIDLIEARLERQYIDADTEVTAQVALSLLSLYKTGEIEVEMVDGEMLYHLTGGAEGGPDANSEGPSAQAAKSPSAGPLT